MDFYAERREKRRLNCRADRQFIDSVASVKGEFKRDQEVEDDVSSTAANESFIVGDAIIYLFSDTLLCYLKYINFLYKRKL